MSHARTPAREGLSKGRSMVVGRARAWAWLLLAGPLLMGACSSESSGDAAGGAPGGGYRSKYTSGGGGPINLGGYSSGDGASSSGMAGGAASNSSSTSSENAGAGGASSWGGASFSSRMSSYGGAGPGGASGYGGLSYSSGKGGYAGAAGAGGASPSTSASGSSTPVPSGGSTAAGGATGTKASTGATGMGGRTSAGGGTGTAGGSSTLPPSRDAGAAMDGGIMSADARGGDCSFSGGSVTGTVYPSGLTLRKACSPYFVNAIAVYDDGVLTIEPGVTVKFSNGGALLVGMQGSGRLVASGSSSELITFTSQEVQPSPGFWRGVVFGGGTTSSKLAYAQVTAAGQSRDGAIVGMAELPANVLGIDHVTIDKVGDGASGILALGEKSSIAITNSAFVDVPAGRYPISVYAASFSSVGAGNTYPSGSAIEVMGGTIDTNVTWTNPGLPVAITGDLSIQGTSSPVLSIGSGMNLKFASNVAVQVGRSAPGKIATTATSSQARVTLTSLASSPASGSWAGLQIWEFGKATLSYTDVRYGGTNNGDSRGNVTVESGAATVQLAVDHSSFSDSLGWGIYVPCAASQNSAIITVDTNTTYANNVLGTKGPGLTCAN